MCEQFAQSTVSNIVGPCSGSDEESLVDSDEAEEEGSEDEEDEEEEGKDWDELEEEAKRYTWMSESIISGSAKLLILQF